MSLRRLLSERNFGCVATFCSQDEASANSCLIFTQRVKSLAGRVADKGQISLHDSSIRKSKNIVCHCLSDIALFHLLTQGASLDLSC